MAKETSRPTGGPNNGMGRVPPHDVEMEKALLGALMLSQNAMYETADLVSPDSFYAGKHRTIYSAMLTLHAKNDPVDVVAVTSKLKERKELKDVGGAAYLSEIVNSAASPGSAKHYAEVVQSKYVFRTLIDAAHTIGELGFEEERDVEQVLDEAQQAMFAVTQAPGMRGFKELKAELGGAMERVENAAKARRSASRRADRIPSARQSARRPPKI